MSVENVRQNISKLKEFNSLIISDFYDKGKPVEDIAKYYNLDMPLLWAILLEDKLALCICILLISPFFHLSIVF